MNQFLAKKGSQQVSPNILYNGTKNKLKEILNYFEQENNKENICCVGVMYSGE